MSLYLQMQPSAIWSSDVWWSIHDDVIKWKNFPHYWPFLRGIHRSPVNSPHKGQWRGALMFSFICAWMTSWINNREPGDLRRHHAQHDVIVMTTDNIGNNNKVKWIIQLCQCVFIVLTKYGIHHNRDITVKSMVHCHPMICNISEDSALPRPYHPIYRLRYLFWFDYPVEPSKQWK